MSSNNENSRVDSATASSSRVVSSAVSSLKFQNKAFTLAVIANVLWGTSFLASKYTLLVWGPFTASTLRFAVALIAMIGIFPFVGTKINRLKSLKDFFAVFIVGVTGFGLLYPLQLTGLQTISSSASAAIMLTSPLFVILLGRVFLSETLSIKKIIAILFGIVGGTLLLSSKLNFQSGFSKGELLTLAASMSLAGSVIATRKFAKHLSVGTLTFWSMFIGFVLLVPFAFHETPKTYQLQNLTNAIASLVYLALICSALCFLLWNRALALAPAKNIASSMHIKTPVAVLIGIFVAAEYFSGNILMGTFIVGIGVWLSQTEGNLFLRIKRWIPTFKNGSYRTFQPDLIVEATTVCDRMCPGCYAPNIISLEDTTKLFRTNPNLFLDPSKLQKGLDPIGLVSSISIRGGEPSRHPLLPLLLEISTRNSREIYLETHGRWILSENDPVFDLLLRSCGHLGVTIKLSFDKMHGLSNEQLQAITNRLDLLSISWLIAVTEKNKSEFLTTRNLCKWIPNSKFIFQKLALSPTELIRPQRGVIHVDGTTTLSLRSKEKFEKASQSEAAKL